ncbi:MAG TPA: histidine phosphatase family protein [Acidimicrobiia bacterium]|nr:histidine phosphatase family protein [Acidimicrobiia bacterium]
MAGDDEVVLVRHGETEWSASGRHTSFTDVALTDAGRAQAASLRARLATRNFALVLTSPRRRACDTCSLAGFLDHAEVTDDLAEWNYGEYEGRTTADIRRDAPGWTIFDGTPPGGETAADVEARADRLLARAVAVDGPVAMFSHGHFLRVLGARWIGLGASAGRLLGLDTATVSVLGHEREQRVLRVWNAGGDPPLA